MAQTRKTSGITRALMIIVGILFIIGGIYAIGKPFTTLITVSLLFGILTLAKGIGQVIVFIKEHIEDKKNDNARGWGEWIHLVYGILLIVAGVFLVGELGITSLAVLWMVGFWFIFDGIQGIVLSSQFCEGGWRVFLIILNILVIVGGFMVLRSPVNALIALNLLVGITIIMDGIQMLILDAYLAR